MPSLLLCLCHCELRGRNGFQPLVRDRLAALHRAAVGSIVEAPVRALDGLQLTPKVIPSALVELVLDQIDRLIAGVEILCVRCDGLWRVDERCELALDPLTFGGQQLTGSCGIHVVTLARSRGAEHRAVMPLNQSSGTCTATSVLG
jgi:hypothetical protein